MLRTTAYGWAPVNQIVVVLADGIDRSVAEALASKLGGSVIGELSVINAYQLTTPGTGEADLTSALETARGTTGVELAAPNQTVAPDAEPGEIWGTRISPLADNPAYANGGADGYNLIGAPAAWDIIRGSGLDLEPTQVGVIDSGLWTGSNEFDSGTRVTFTEPDAQLGAPEKGTNPDRTVSDDPSGGHGSGVNILIGGDPDDGGPAGVASVMGDRLTISNTNLWAGQYGTGFTAAPADPEDPTIVEDPVNGATYQYGDLVAIMAQVNAGSKVINMSWGPSDYTKVNPSVPAIYRKFFEKMGKDHPDVLFVAAAGNDGVSGDGTQHYPGGFNLPNVMTVGNVTNDGTIWTSSNTPGNDFEVTIFAPGHQAVRGYNPDTGEIKNIRGGTSMAAPQVAATAALLLSLDKTLTAAQIKEIIARNAKAKDGTPILSVEDAVLEVVNARRAAMGLPALDTAALLDRGVVDAVAVPSAGVAGVYVVRGVVKGTPDSGVDLTISVADGEVTSGDEPTHLDAAGDATWTITLDPPDQGRIVVHRADNGAGSVITIATIDVNGAWAGTFTLTEVTVDEATAEQAKEQGCDLALLDALKGKALPMTMDLAVDPGSTGTSSYLIDLSSLQTADGKPMESSPQDAPVSYQGNLLTFTIEGGTGSTTSMTGTVSLVAGTPTITGAVSISGAGYSAKGVWALTKSGG